MLAGPGVSLVLASSVPQQLDGVTVHRLPSIHEADFEARFLELVERFHVSRINSPVASVFAHVKKLIERKRLPLTIVGGSPQEKAIAGHRALASRARRLFAHARAVSDGVEPEHLGRLHALLMLTRQIYGETNQDKLSAMFAAMASTVPGDVVEIGALAGRSAVALGYLANLFRVGPVLAVDPWSPASAMQYDSPALIQELPDAWNLDDVFDLFLSNLALVAAGTANYCARRRLTRQRALSAPVSASRRRNSAASPTQARSRSCTSTATTIWTPCSPTARSGCPDQGRRLADPGRLRLGARRRPARGRRRDRSSATPATRCPRRSCAARRCSCRWSGRAPRRDRLSTGRRAPPR